jgi:hypothetical protein
MVWIGICERGKCGVAGIEESDYGGFNLFPAGLLDEDHADCDFVVALWCMDGPPRRFMGEVASQ